MMDAHEPPDVNMADVGTHHSCQHTIEGAGNLLNLFLHTNKNSLLVYRLEKETLHSRDKMQ